MAGRVQYQKIVKYLAAVTCTEPLHIGSSAGDKGDVLVHPVENVPFLQATGIAGVFREYYERQYGSKDAEELFGAMCQNENGGEQESRVKFSDGTFVESVLEYRPRVRINRDTGTCDASGIRGTDKKAGHKFSMEYVGEGAKVNFAVYLYDESKAERLECVFAALHKGALQIGGQKSNGCGCFSVDGLHKITFDLTTQEGRSGWSEEDSLPLEQYDDLTKEICNKSIEKDYYEIVVKGKTEGALLVKGMAVVLSADGTTYSENVRNAKKEYIVPGSSFKGAVRSQMERIACYLSKDAMIEDAFGKAGKSKEQGKAGCVYFYDAVIGAKEVNDKVKPSHRIRIDKFTGSVFNGGLFSERNVYGEVEFRISVKKNEKQDDICGLLLMALRDLAIGTMNLGGGYNVGKGFVDVSEIVVKDNRYNTATIDFKTGKISDDTKIISRCMKAISGTEENNGI